MARTGILGCIFDPAFFFCGPRSGEEVENERHEGGERERTKSQGLRGLGDGRGKTGPGRDGRGKTGDAGPEAHTRRKKDRQRKREKEREREREKAREKEGAQTHVLRILRRARTHVRQRTRRARAHTISAHTGVEAF